MTTTNSSTIVMTTLRRNLQYQKQQKQQQVTINNTSCQPTSRQRAQSSSFLSSSQQQSIRLWRFHNYHTNTKRHYVKRKDFSSSSSSTINSSSSLNAMKASSYFKTSIITTAELMTTIMNRLSLSHPLTYRFFFQHNRTTRNSTSFLDRVFIFVSIVMITTTTASTYSNILFPSNDFHYDNNDDNGNDDNALDQINYSNNIKINNNNGKDIRNILPLSLLLQRIQSDIIAATNNMIIPFLSRLYNSTDISIGSSIDTTKCGSYNNDGDDDMMDSSGYTESERFYQCLKYHRALLSDYQRRWEPQVSLQNDNNNDNNVDNIHNDNSSYDISAWPTNIPTSSQLPSLIMDLEFCYASLLQSNNSNNIHHNTLQKKVCQDQQFKIASFYVCQTTNNTNTLHYVDDDMKKHGYKLIKELAEQGHPDSMCLLGILLNEGRIPGIDMNPKLAVRWWRRCVDDYKHICAMYELGNAYYLGEGLLENPSYAVRLFIRSANLGHPGAAYMLGECLLDGVGITRDRANALEWLVTSGELGHPLARRRVLFILQQEEMNDESILNSNGSNGNQHHKQQNTNHNRRHDTKTMNHDDDSNNINNDTSSEDNEIINNDNNSNKLNEDNTLSISSSNEDNEEVLKWMTHQKTNRKVNVERYYTIGGGSTNPVVLASRKTKVAESRGQSSSSS